MTPARTQELALSARRVRLLRLTSFQESHVEELNESGVLDRRHSGGYDVGNDAQRRHPQ
eukprot:CAMPEP_0170148756 /NCGR_PEP_ID=MMETSP0033_2-20121228/40248_1 /TAXON_ID=195969 /ORGANISM="Dolichomastix tenuilepis, Strain CCMP3274" /LENGTH=58 /DNA_ID=CAMNT_0010385663 /DNA_START=38 /DNA_END=211 /DNA_ORIENTATION=-